MRQSVILLLGVALMNGAISVAASSDDALEEVIVTARKRAENIQRVPDSVTAFTTTQIV